ncbi:MAG: hypothetical protein JXX28_02420 [Deltaproteobacteria bacterium]|nr:hypothetical protein [Deltaproteobacteria bacterium]
MRSDLRVEGVLTLEDLPDAVLVDPLALLPTPEDDRELFRTFPGRPDRGEVRWEPLDDGRWRFSASLPRRYGDTGALRGLMANGTWYPAITVDGAPPELSWEVSVRLPAGAVGALGSSWGEGLLSWSGRADRASLAVYPGGSVTRVSEEVVLLSRRAARPRLVWELQDALQWAAERTGAPLSGVVVEAPLRRRLARPGAGLAYLSDRAFRVSPGTWRFHRVSAARGVYGGLLPEPDPFTRSLEAAALAWGYRASLDGLGAGDALSYASWTPRVDALIYNRTMPFFSDVFEEVQPSDPVRDDLMELLNPAVPGQVVWQQLLDRFGEERADGTLTALLTGEPPPLPEGWLDRYRTAQDPRQDYRLLPCRADGLWVERQAQPHAPPEVLMWSSEEGSHLAEIPAGPGLTALSPACPGRVVLDPGRHLAQSSRQGDSWPPRTRLTVASWVSAVSLTPLYVEASGGAWLRRSDDTHNLWSGGLSTGETDWLNASLAYTRAEGPLITGRRRAHNLSLWASGSALRPSYAEVQGGLGALQGGVTWQWDNRPATEFPRAGQALMVGLSSGGLLGGSERWRSARANYRAITSPHPRLALAGKGAVAVAEGEVAQRLLSLGAPAALRSIPGGEVVGVRRATLVGEARWAPIRGASVPALLAWGSELQLTAGAEVGTVWLPPSRSWEPRATVSAPSPLSPPPTAGWVSAAGLTVGGSVTGDLLGFDPSSLGLTVALPIWAEGLSVRGRTPQLVVRWGQEF